MFVKNFTGISSLFTKYWLFIPKLQPDLIQNKPAARGRGPLKTGHSVRSASMGLRRAALRAG